MTEPMDNLKKRYPDGMPEGVYEAARELERMIYRRDQRINSLLDEIREMREILGLPLKNRITP